MISLKKKKLKHIYYGSFLILIVIPILIIFSAAIWLMKMWMEERAIQGIERVQYNMCMSLEKEIDDASLRLSHFLYVNDGTVTEVAARTDTEDPEEKREWGQQLSAYFNFTMSPIEDIVAAAFFMKSGNFTGLKDDLIIPLDEVKQTQWYQKALETKDRVAVGSFCERITVSKYGQHPFYIAVGISPDRKLDHSQKIEMTALFILSDLEKLIKQNAKDSSLGHTLILGEQDEVLYDPFDAAKILKNVHLKDGKDRFLDRETGVQYVTVSRKIEGTDWRMVNIVKARMITGAFLRMAANMLLIITVILILFYIFSNYFLRNIIQPVNSIIDGLKVVETGNLDVHIDPCGQSEVRVMIHSFNQMVRRLKALIEENEMQQQKKQEAEIRALQSQINPHFLVNSLSSIRFMAQVSRFEGIRKMAEALIKILSSSFRSNRSTCTLEEELEVLDSFVFLMSIRYSNGFQFEKQIEESCLNYQVPRLILQPLVENAIVHAFTEKEEIGVIWLKIYEENGWVILAVEDNGKGISQEIQEKLLIQEERTDNLSIGLQNVYTRLRLNYGEYCRFHIDSREGAYTRISIALKKEKMEKKDENSTDCR